ncbi:MAG: phosphopentomutase [Firmicutes bacterium]|nr:phosphopentomutase [Bacillota bacterium]
MDKMRTEDIVMVTADHGCDPGFKGTDHTREYVPLLAYGQSIQPGVNLGTRQSFADIGATILDLFDIQETVDGESFKGLIVS